MPKLSPREWGVSQANFGEARVRKTEGTAYAKSGDERERGWTGMAQSLVDSGKNLEFKL